MGQAQSDFGVMILEFPLTEKLDSTAHFILNKMDLRDGFFQTAVDGPLSHTKSSIHRWHCTGSAAPGLVKGTRWGPYCRAQIGGGQSSPHMVTCAFLLAPHRVRCR